MAKTRLQKPTTSELELLRILWTQGPCTVRQVHEALGEQKSIGYTSVLKLLQIMTTKGLVRRNEQERAHVYEAHHSPTEMKRQLAGDVLRKVFGGSASELMMHALEGRTTTKQELQDLRRLLDKYEDKAQ